MVKHIKKAYAEQNRASWNAVTAAHNSHKGDQGAFFRAGGSTLFPEERELLQLREGISLLHLQCNCGQDSLSLVQLGAEVTGVDISDKAIDFARQLSQDSALPARFERADIFAWFEAARCEARRFERVFSSYGAIGWLGDLDAWARGIFDVLHPEGLFVLVEYHPILWCISAEGKWSNAYFNDDMIQEDDGVWDYVGDSGGTLSPSGFAPGVENFKNPEVCFEFMWTMADVVTALLKAGLELRALREYPYSNGCRFFAEQEQLPGKRFGQLPGMPNFPQMFSVVARKPA